MRPINLRDIINILLTSFSWSVLSAMGPCFSLLFYGPCTLRFGHKSTGKNLVRNLQYGPRTWLVRGIYLKYIVIVLIDVVRSVKMVSRSAKYILSRKQTQASAKQPECQKTGIIFQCRGSFNDQSTTDAGSQLH